MKKQIEERRDISDIIYWSGYGFDRGTCNDLSKQIQEQGYRKASEVAREIFADLKAIWNEGRGFIDYGKLVRLERIYTEDVNNGT